MAAHCSTMNLGLTHSLYTGTAYLNLLLQSMDGRNPGTRPMSMARRKITLPSVIKARGWRNVTVSAW
jgi:hypothetical protein